jgi:hypothetical protein
VDDDVCVCSLCVEDIADDGDDNQVEWSEEEWNKEKWYGTEWNGVKW